MGRGLQTVEGTVRWFNAEKGFGFLASEGVPDDIFVHYSAIEAEGWRSLQAGARVRFDLEMGPRGPRAFRVRVLTPPASGGNAHRSRPNGTGS